MGVSARNMTLQEISITSERLNHLIQVIAEIIINLKMDSDTALLTLLMTYR